MDADGLKTFASQYAAAWCSQQPANVARFFSNAGSLTINVGAPSVGRTAIAAAAREFMTGFPDMVVTLDDVTGEGDHAVFRWTLTGTNTGPGGTGQSVRISGYEEWTFGVTDSSRSRWGTSTTVSISVSCERALGQRDTSVTYK